MLKDAQCYKQNISRCIINIYWNIFFFYINWPMQNICMGLYIYIYLDGNYMQILYGFYFHTYFHIYLMYINCVYNKNNCVYNKIVFIIKIHIVHIYKQTHIIH